MKGTSSSVMGLILITLFSAAAARGSSSRGQAAVKLLNASATISRTSDTDWTLKLLRDLAVFAGAFRLYRQKDRTPSASQSRFMHLRRPGPA